MNKVSYPIKPQAQGSAVADLQAALQLLLERRVLLRKDERERSAILARFSQEASRFGEATRMILLAFQEQQQLPASGEVDAVTAAALNRAVAELHDEPSKKAYVVHGVVEYEDGSPAAGVKVCARDRDLRSEQHLGDVRARRDGSYRIEYTEADFRAREKGSADLVVRALDAEDTVLVASPIVFNAPPDAELNLTIPADRCRPPSLFEKIRDAIAPLLGEIAIANLEEVPSGGAQANGASQVGGVHQDLTFLSGETGFAKRDLARLVIAHQFLKLGLEPEFWFALLGGSIFEYTPTKSLRENASDVRAALPRVDENAVRKALARAFNVRDIPAASAEKADEWVRSFLKIAAENALGTGDGRTFLKNALEHAGVDALDKQVTFARLFNRHRASMSDLWAALAEEPNFDEKEIADLRTSYGIADLTRSDFSLVGVLKDRFDVRRPEQIRKLAKRGASEWIGLVEELHRAGKIELPEGISELAGALRGPANVPDTEIYGSWLEQQFRDAYPTAAFAGGLGRALSNGGSHGLKYAKDLGALLDAHPDFELLRTPIDAFLDNGMHPAVRAAAQAPGFRSELKAVQRVFKLAPTFEAADAMLADGVHSAQLVYRMGQSEFVRRYQNRAGFSSGSAALAWNRAASTHAAVLTWVGDLKALDGESQPLVLKHDDAALSKFPNWNNLFQGGDTCNCEDCRSVLSPAAYFTDLVMFLRDRRALNPASSVKDVLFARRPDLGYLELNCDNAYTTLPYVDVVCEVLEHVVAAGGSDVELAGFTAVPADAATAKAAAGAALDAAGLDVGSDFTLNQIDPSNPNRWVVHGETATYLLKKKATANFFAELLPNTKASAGELRAYPAYIDGAAYEKLRQARFPLALPFDLFAEEVRAAFQKCNLQRWDLMRTLHGTAAPNNATEGEIAAEYFGISCDGAAPFDEKRLILVADSSAAGQQALWGESGNAGWLTAVSNVETFLRKTSLEYEDLLGMLDLPFINPAKDIVIRHLDPSCDTNQKVIEALDATKLDRIHRFLRLWRKLGNWKMWELDLAIFQSGVGNGSLDEAFLVNLHYLSLVRAKLGKSVSVAQACALFGDLSVETHFTAAYEKRSDSLYESLFLNKRLIQPLDPAFEVSSVAVPAPTAEKISGHASVILAALGIQQNDLARLTGLTRPSNGSNYISDDLTLHNLSFLWRHAWLPKMLKLKSDEWVTTLHLLQRDIDAFADPKTAWTYLEQVEKLRTAGLTRDELAWILSADRSAKAATKEADAARFLATLRADLKAVHAAFDPAQYDYLSPPSDVDRLAALLTSLLQQLHRDEKEAQFFVDILRDQAAMQRVVPGLPAGFQFPPAITDTIPILYDESATTVRYTGYMTLAQRTTLLTDASLAAVTGIAAYQQAIEYLFQTPRLALKFFDPVFRSPLASLPPAVDFAALSDPSLATKISYDAEQRVLQMTGILSADGKAALDALSADVPYRNAVNSIFTQPTLGAFPPEALWLEDANLLFPLRSPDNPLTDNLKDNLATAVNQALAYLSRTGAENVVVREASSQLGLTESLTRGLLTAYAILPETLLAYLTGPFAATSGVVDYATLTDAFDSWFWAIRVAALWTKWKLTFVDWQKLRGLTAPAQLLDFAALPLDDSQAMASIDVFLRTSRLFYFRERVPETGITLLEVLEKLRDGTYPAVSDFALDVELLDDDWNALDVAALVGSLDLAYPNGYLLAEAWERLARAFYFVGGLGAGAASALTFAAPTMTAAHAGTLKSLLRSKFGTETWLVLSPDIQDVLRERKRDALSAYLLSLPAPADAPSGKWDNTNDLYAYYLLDVEMCACQLTSRLVQASGSVQLFVQRCFMGLEPQVRVVADGSGGDSAWRWWAWMRKYRVWEANRKVFLWPENWIEPELKKDRSSFFKQLENDLAQNDINADTVEAAFTSYLEKLDGVARLEIAGFYQEDDGDDTLLHVFGRTTGTEPHAYYYRRFDYRQWTPWEKVDLDIQGDYLVPAVVGKRPFLFWPVFTEVQDEAGNSSLTTPTANSSYTPKKAQKMLQMQLAVSDYRQGKWTPKRVSKDRLESAAYDVEIARDQYQFLPVDRSDVDGRFGIQVSGSGTARNGTSGYASLGGAFEISGCQGVPVQTGWLGTFPPAVRPEQEATGFYTEFLKWRELASRADAPENDFALENQFLFTSVSSSTRLLEQTPGIFQMTPPAQLSYLDKLLLKGRISLGFSSFVERLSVPSGSWLPFFYDDAKRTFFVLPVLAPGRQGETAQTGLTFYYPEVKAFVRRIEAMFQGILQTWIDALDLGAIPAAERQALESFLQERFRDQPPPPYTDDDLKALLLRFYMGIVDYYIGIVAFAIYQQRRFHFKNFYHPFVCDFAKTVYDPLQGVPGLMKREMQLQNSGFRFARNYLPTASVLDPSTEDFYPAEIVDFSADGAYAPYNWELFFHAPLLIANSLSKNQRFEEARNWYHYIFNPIGVESSVPGGSPMSKYWITKPFFETTDPVYVQQRIENILRMLAGDTSVPGYSKKAKKALEDHVLDWQKNPFEPHRIASYRTVAYQKTVVMKYLDNLIAWGDNLFRQDSMESINEATELYVLAAELLGPKPRKVPPQVKPPVETFNELEPSLDKFANALVEVENLVPQQLGDPMNLADAPPLPMLYFCVPPNENLLAYWDTVADRLYKIRHCMNIEGVVRQLALFEPPIDPGALVKAVAAGMDIGAAIADLNAPLPLYRFNTLLQKANEVVNDVKSLGAALLSALEKKDVEALSLLRQSHEIRLLEAIKAVKDNQIAEASEALAAAQKGKELAQIKKQYYESRPFMNAGEAVAVALNTTAAVLDASVSVGYITAGVLNLIPAFILGAAGFGGSPHVTAKTGGDSFGPSAKFAAEGLGHIARTLDKMASLSSTLGSYSRRQEEWDFQRDLAAKDMEQADKAIAAATLRVSVAQQESENQSLQIENAKAVDAFMRSKYTNQELYQWMLGQISGVYFQAYRLAYDLAKRAERCYRFELGLKDSSFINFGYWDSLKKGLLSAESLQYDLHRMEAAYLEQNRREFELTKHVSLALLDPLALVKLRETGRCFFSIPEARLDLDYPGHYFRRIKSVSLTLPCVAGPYTTISCTLRLLKNSVRINTAKGDDGYPRNVDENGLPADDPRFVENTVCVKAIAASGAQNDSGMFELSFRDERYLPFEGAGAISDWSIELFNDLPSNNPDPTDPDFGRPLRQFDYSTITDAVLHLKYTAREDAGAFRNDAISHLRTHFSEAGATPSMLILDLGRDFPSEWARFLEPTDPTKGNVLDLDMSARLFPIVDEGKTLIINSIQLLARCTDAGSYGATLTPPLPAVPAGANKMSLAKSVQFGGLHVAQKDVSAYGIQFAPNDAPATWSIKVTRPGGGALQLDPATKAMEIAGMILVLGYQWA